MTITDDRVLDIARKWNAYEPDGKTVTLRGDAIVEFGRALLAEHEAARMAPRVELALAESEGGEA